MSVQCLLLWIVSFSRLVSREIQFRAIISTVSSRGSLIDVGTGSNVQDVYSAAESKICVNVGANSLHPETDHDSINSGVIAASSGSFSRPFSEVSVVVLDQMKS